MLSVLKKVGGFFSAAGKKIYGLYVKNPILFCVITGILLEIYIEFFSRHSFIKGFQFMFGTPLTFLYNCLIVIFTLAISIVLKRSIAMFMTSFLLWIGFGTANAIILINRAAPFTFSDFLTLPSVLGIFTIYLKVYQIVIIVISLVLAVVGLVFMWIKAPKRELHIKRDVISFVATAALLGIATPIGLLTGGLQSDYSDLIAGYNKGGFPYSFMRSLLVHGISEPDGYDKDDVDAVLNAIADKKSNDTSANIDESDKPNIIFVQLESFFDINAVKGVTFSEDPMPNFNKLKKECLSGFLTVPLIGSGTANTEFEILTGMNINYFSAGANPFIEVLCDKTSESMAYVLGAKGYKTHAMHNNTGTFYNRHKVYANIGFDTFTPVENMYNIEKNALDWVKDSLYLDEIRYTIEATPERDFVFAVTVQPHGQYPAEQIPGYEYGITVSGLTDEELYHKYSYYVNEVHETDKLIKELTDYYSSYNEKTVIVFYGDHLPDIRLEADDLSRGDLYSAEYIVWSNYGLGEGTKAPETLEAYQLYSYVFGLMGIKDGVMNGIHQYLSDSEDYGNAMHLIEYDMLYGKRYVCGGKPYEPTDLKFGMREVAVSGAVMGADGTVTVYGTNFNEASVVYVNGKRYTTQLQPNGSVVCYGVKNADKMEIVVKQESDGGLVFRESEKYVWQK